MCLNTSMQVPVLLVRLPYSNHHVFEYKHAHASRIVPVLLVLPLSQAKHTS